MRGFYCIDCDDEDCANCETCRGIHDEDQWECQECGFMNEGIEDCARCMRYRYENDHWDGELPEERY